MAQEKALMKDVFGSSDEDDDDSEDEQEEEEQQERRPTNQAASSPPPARRPEQAAEQPLALTAAQGKGGAGAGSDDEDDDDEGDGDASSPSSSSDAASQEEEEEEPSASDASDKAKRHKSKHKKSGDKKRHGDKSSKKSNKERDKLLDDDDEGGGRVKGKAIEPAKHKLSKLADKSVESDSEPEGDSRKALVARDHRDSDSEASSDDNRHPKQKKIEYGPPLHLEAPLLDPPVGTDDQLHVIRCSNILGVETKPFDPDTFELEEDAYLDDQGQQRIKLRDANTVRWRVTHDEDTGNEVHESNARLVKWSDGSMQLLLGGEVLDVVFQSVATDNSFLFVRHEGLIQGQGQIASRLNYRPSSLASKSHKMLAAAIDKRHAKTVRMKKTSAVKDPKLAEQELHAQEEQRIRAQVERLEKMQYKVAKKYQAPPISTQKQALSARFLEEDMDDADNDTNPRRMLTGEEEAEAEQRILRAKRDAPSSSSRLPPPSLKKSRPAYEPTRRPTYESMKRPPARGRASSESDDEDLSEDDDPPPPPAKETPVKQKRKVILSDDSD